MLESLKDQTIDCHIKASIRGKSAFFHQLFILNLNGNMKIYQLTSIDIVTENNQQEQKSTLNISQIL